MSKEVDQRVVEMRFDNKQFERNVRTSISTLDRLKESLKLKDASKSLEDVEKAAKKIDFSTLNQSVETISSKFSALETIAVGALLKIGSQAVTAGERLLKSLTVDNISAGFDKLAKKTTAVGTLVAQGYDMSVVEEQLKRLNWFTDETSYNFTDMVESIAKFTASGQKLPESVTALEGVATWAALSGQNAQKASSAMYQLSQAMGAGVMRKEDYKSIQNLSMDTTEFRQKALDAGVALGTLRKNADGTYHSLKATGKSITDFDVNQFAEHLTQDQWFTSDVMMKVFNDYSAAVDQVYEYAEEKGITASEAIEALGDSVDEFGLKAFRAAQEAKTWGDVVDSVKDAVGTGWMNTFELIFGNYEEQRKLWTDLANELYDVFAEGGNARNEMLKAWKEAGGRDDLIEAFWNIFNTIRDIAKPIKEAFQDIFPPMTSERLVEFTKNLKEFTERLKLSDETSKKIKTTFKGLFSILGIVSDVIGAVINGIKGFSSTIVAAGSGLLDLASSIGQFLINLRTTIQKSKIFEKAVAGISKVITFLLGIIQPLINKIGELFGIFGKKFDDGNIKSVNSGLEEMESRTNILGAIVNGFASVFDVAWKTIKKIVGYIGTALGTIWNGLKEAFSGNSVFDTIKSFFGVLISYKLFQFASGLNSALSTIKEGIISFLSGFEADKTDTLMGTAKALLMLVAAVAILSAIDADKLIVGIGAIELLFKVLASANKMVSGADSTTIKGGITGILDSFAFAQTAKGLQKMAVAIIALSAALYIISKIDTDKLIFGLASIGIMIEMLVRAANKLGKSKDQGKMLKGATNAIIFAAAIVILASALRIIASLSLEQLAIGMVGLIGIVALLVASAKILGNSKDQGRMLKGATNAILFATAVVILASALRIIASLSWEQLAIGIIGLTGIVALLVTSAKILGNSKDQGSMLKGAMNALIFAAAIIVLSSALKMVASLSWEQLAIGVAGLTGISVLLVASAKILGNSKDQGRMLKGAMNALIFASAIAILGAVLKSIATLSWGELAVGLVGLLVVIGLLVTASVILGNQNGGNMLKSAASMLIIATSLIALAAALKIIGSMSIGQVATGLIAIAAAFTIIGVAALLLKPLVGTIAALAGAIALIGVAALAFGAGLALTSAALLLFAAASQETVNAIINIFISLITALPNILTALAKALEASIGSIITLVVTMISGILQAILQVVPEAVAVVLELILSTLRAVADNIQPIVKALLDILVGVIEGLVVGLPKLITSTIKLIRAVIDAVISALDGLDVGKVLVATGAIAAMIALMALIAVFAAEAIVVTALLPPIGTNLSAFIQNAKPFLDEIQKVNPASLQGAKALAETILILTAAGIMDALTSWFTGGNQMIKFGEELAAFAPYLKIYADELKDVNASDLEASSRAVKSLAETVGMLSGDGILSAFSGNSKLSDFGKELQEFGPLLKEYGDSVTGIKSDEIQKSAVAAKALCDLENALKNHGGTWQKLIGDSSLATFAADLVSLAPNLVEYGNTVDGINVEAIEESIRGASALAEFEKTLKNHGGAWQLLTGDNSLSQFASDLIELAPKLVDYSAIVTGLETDPIIKSTEAAMALSDLASSLKDHGGVWGFLKGDNSLSSFANDLILFAPKLIDYSNIISDVNVSSIIRSSAAIGSLIAIANLLDDSGGLFSVFSGDNDLSSFGEQLPKFGEGLKAFSDSINGFDSERVNNIVPVAEKLIKMGNSLENNGGLISVFTGDNNLASFGIQLPLFGAGLKAYSDQINGFNSDAVSESTVGAEALIDLANKLNPSGGLISIFTGDNTLSGFGIQLALFGYGLKAYSDEINGFNSEAVTAATSGISSLIELANNLSPSGGLLSIFTGDNTLSGFGNQLPEFARGLKAYSDEIGTGFNTEAVVASATAATSLSEFAETFKDGVSLKTLGADLASFGRDFKAYYETISGIKGETVSATTSRLNAIARFANSISDESKLSIFGEELSTLAKGLKDYQESVNSINLSKISEIGNQILDTIATSINDSSTKLIRSDLSWAINSFVNKIIKAIESKKDETANKFVEFISSCVEAIRNKRIDLYNAGGYIVEGLANGIRQNGTTAISAAEELANNLVLKLKEKLKIKSPSKVTKNEVGRYIVEGIAEGITSNMSAEEAAKKKAENIINAFKTEFDKHDSKIGLLSAGYDLWESKNQNVSYDTKDSVKINTLKAYLPHLEEDIKLAEANYRIMVEQFGEGSNQAISAKKELFERQKAYYENLNEQASLLEGIRNRRNDLLDRRDELNEEEYKKLQNSFDYSTTEAEKTEAEHEYLLKKLKIQAERTVKAEQDHIDAIKKYGEKSKEAEESYIKFLKEQNNYASVTSDLQANIDANASSANNKDTSRAFFDLLKDADLLMTQLGMDKSQVIKWAAQQTGYDASKMLFNTVLDGHFDEWLQSGSSELDVYKRAAQISGLKNWEAYVYEMLTTSEKIAERQNKMGGIALEDVIASIQKMLNYDPDSKKLDESNAQEVANKVLADAKLSFNPDSMTASIVDGVTANILSSGESVAFGVGTGIQNGTSGVQTAVQALSDTCSGTLESEDNKKKWQSAGSYLVDGFIEGVKSKMEAAAAAAAEMARIAYEAAADILGIESPSKAFAELGRFSDIGYAKGLMKWARVTSDASEEVGSGALNRMHSIISKAVDVINGEAVKPSIRPVIDMNNSMRFATAAGVSFRRSREAALAASREYGSDYSEGGENQNGAPTYNFTQNNYSPKALSQFEIYRQTKNQLAMLKGLVKK